MLPFPGVQGLYQPEDHGVARRQVVGEAGSAPGGVFDDGTREEEGPVTWETLVFPRENPVARGAGDPSPHTVSARGWRARRGWAARYGGSAKKKPSVSWQGHGKGKGAVADGDEGVGGPHMSDEAG